MLISTGTANLSGQQPCHGSHVQIIIKEVTICTSIINKRVKDIRHSQVRLYLKEEVLCNTEHH